MKFNLFTALAIVATGFVNRFDKGGKPYMLHCLYVMEAGETENERIAFLLHDCVEDDVITIRELRNQGCPEESLRILGLLTHLKDQDTYRVYIKKISTCPIATKGKLKDLEHNTQVSRLKSLSKKNMDKIEEYFWAYTYLSGK